MKTGLKYPVYATATDSGSAMSYANGAVFGKAVDAVINIVTNNIKARADDADAESDRSFSSGTITMSIDDFSSQAKIDMLGYVEGSEVDAITGEKELTTAGSESPYMGFGFYSKGKKTSVNYWRAVWLIKTQFGEPEDSFKTQGETMEFMSQAVVGNILTSSWDSTYWKDEARFSTEAGAIAWLRTKAGISVDASNNITALAFANGTLTPTFAAGTYIYSCSCTDDTTITATFAAGTAKVYVDGTYLEDLTTTVASSTITMSAGNNKIVQIVVQESGKSSVTYTIVTQRPAA